MVLFTPGAWSRWLLVCSLLALAAGAGQAQTTPAPDKNLLANGLFENGLEGWTVNANQKKGTAVIDDTEKHQGKPTVRVDSPEGDDVHVKQKVTVQPNTKYRLEGYIKTKNVEPLKRESKDGACLALEGGYQKSQIVSKSKGWTKVTLEFATGTQTEVELGARLGFYYNLVKGTAWFSELSLERVGKATPVRR
jgi:hypothetical protein